MDRSGGKGTQTSCDYGICILSVDGLCGREILRYCRYHRCIYRRTYHFNTSKSDFVLKKFDTMSYMLLSPVFFASIGLKVELPKMSAAIVGFAVALTIVAILTKIVGCALGAKMCGYKNYQCARIGVGMISRGEVALIVASKGEALGMLGGNFLGPVIIVVVITTIITPILLKIVFKSGPNVSTLEKGKEVTSFYEDIEKKRTE